MPVKNGRTLRNMPLHRGFTWVCSSFYPIFHSFLSGRRSNSAHSLITLLTLSGSWEALGGSHPCYSPVLSPEACHSAQTTPCSHDTGSGRMVVYPRGGRVVYIPRWCIYPAYTRVVYSPAYTRVVVPPTHIPGWWSLLRTYPGWCP